MLNPSRPDVHAGPSRPPELAARHRRPPSNPLRLLAQVCVDLARNEIIVRQGKGGEDRVTVVPASLVSNLRQPLTRTRLDGSRALRNIGLEASCRRSNGPSPRRA